MRGNGWSTATVVAVLCLLSMLVIVKAECPNGCSGYGDCQSKDMCKCYKNYQGNDCGDRTCPFGRAHVDTPKGDINMDKDRLTSGFILTDSQQAPAGTYEYFSPDASADEAHFYMECSNKGICDRSTGLCQCFDGYEGTGCRRTTCPGKCNGHGTCESIRELGVKEAGTLFGRKGRAGAVVYDLWDGNSTYGCRCDPWYHGPDCVKRSCKVGVDPLFLGVGVPTYETFIVHAGADAGQIANAWIRLRLFDYHGESYITKKITVTGTAATDATAVANAIKAVPNLTFAKVDCLGSPAGTGSSPLKGFISVSPAAAGMSVACMFSDNPGKMRIPEIADSGNLGTGKFVAVTTTTQQGFDEEWFTTMSADVATGVSGDSMSITLSAVSTLTNGYQLVKIDDNIVLVNGAAAGTPNTLTLEYGTAHAISGSIFTATAGLLTIITNGPAISATVNVGDDFFTFANTLTSAPYSAGDLLIFHNQFFNVQQVYKGTGTTGWFVKLDKPFGGKAKDGTASTVANAFKPHRVAVGIELTAGNALIEAVANAAIFKFSPTPATAPYQVGDFLLLRNQLFKVKSAVKDGTTSWKVTVDAAYAGTSTATETVYKVSVTPGLPLTVGNRLFAAAADTDTVLKMVGADGVPAPYAVGDYFILKNQLFKVTAVGTQDATDKFWPVTVDPAIVGTAATTDSVNKIGWDSQFSLVSKVDKSMVYKYVSECSGRGMCNYETGICSCFKGYTDDNCDTQNILAV